MVTAINTGNRSEFDRKEAILLNLRNDVFCRWLCRGGDDQ